MNIKFTFILGIFLTLGTTQAQRCSQIVKRPNINELTPEQFQRFANAVKKLNSNGPMGNIHDNFTQIHVSNSPHAHNVPAFLPWHRNFIKRYEIELQKIDKSVVLPYWDWSRDAYNPARSRILSNQMFGADGRSGDRCVANGAFANMQVDDGNRRRRCLQRSFKNGQSMGPFVVPSLLEGILVDDRSYGTFRRALEGEPHALVHNYIGGDMSTMRSPSDPIFYLHHTFVDLLWSEWQTRHPNLAKTYNDPQVQVNANDQLAGLGANVASTFDTRAYPYCYYYDRYSANTQIVRSAVKAIRRDNRSKSSGARPFTKSALKAYNETQTPLDAEIDQLLKQYHKSNSFKTHPFKTISKKISNMVHHSSQSDQNEKIPLPAPLTKEFIKAMGIDEKEYKKNREKNKKLVFILNRLPEFKPKYPNQKQNSVKLDMGTYNNNNNHNNHNNLGNSNKDNNKGKHNLKLPFKGIIQQKLPFHHKPKPNHF